jgi:hypothetical protein
LCIHQLNDKAWDCFTAEPVCVFGMIHSHFQQTKKVSIILPKICQSFYSWTRSLNAIINYQSRYSILGRLFWCNVNESHVMLCMFSNQSIPRNKVSNVSHEHDGHSLNKECHVLVSHYWWAMNNCMISIRGFNSRGISVLSIIVSQH